MIQGLTLGRKVLLDQKDPKFKLGTRSCWIRKIQKCELGRKVLLDQEDPKFEFGTQGPVGLEGSKV